MSENIVHSGNVILIKERRHGMLVWMKVRQMEKASLLPLRMAWRLQKELQRF